MIKRLKKSTGNIIIFFLLYSCESPAGFPGASNNIKEAKNRDIFIAEYNVKPNPYKINDTIQIIIKEAWLEQRWAHGANEEETFVYPSGGYQLCINSDEKDLKRNSFDWTIGIDGDLYLRRSSNSSLIGDFKTVPGDTIEYKVQKGHNLSDKHEKMILGHFVIFKKK